MINMELELTSSSSTTIWEDKALRISVALKDFQIFSVEGKEELNKVRDLKIFLQISKIYLEEEGAVVKERKEEPT